MRMPALVPLMLLAGAARAEDPTLPAKLGAPEVVYGRATAVGTKPMITLKMIDMKVVEKVKIEKVEKIATKLVDGKTIQEKVVVDVPVKITALEPAGWRDVILTPGEQGVSVVDVSGKPVSADTIKTTLTKNKPVLLALNGSVDPFYLATVKPDTLIIQASPDAVYPRHPGPLSPPEVPLPAPLPSPKNTPIPVPVPAKGVTPMPMPIPAKKVVPMPVPVPAPAKGAAPAPTPLPLPPK